MVRILALVVVSVSNFFFMPLLAAAAPIIGGLLNSASSLWTNHQSQKFSEKMYDRTRSDNLQFWNMQNDYNSPASQMARFKSAGLNPNLIYGQGNSGNAGSIPTPEVKAVDFKDPRVGDATPDPLSILLAQADLKIKAAQADNLQVQNDVIREDAMLRRFQAQRAGFDLAFEQELRPFSADARRESVRQMRTSTYLSLNRDAREAASNATSINEAIERMLSIREQRTNTVLDRSKTYSDMRLQRAQIDEIRQRIEISKKEGILKDLDVKFSRDNIRPGDPLWYRLLSQALGQIFEVPSFSPPASVPGYREFGKY